MVDQKIVGHYIESLLCNQSIWLQIHNFQAGKVITWPNFNVKPDFLIEISAWLLK